MRIVIDLTSLADNFSGIERYAASISRALIQQYDEEYILLFKDSIHPMFNEIVKKVNVQAIILPRCNKLFFNQIRLPWAIHRIKADWYLFMAFPVPIFQHKKNMVSTIHDICCWDCPETMNGASKWYFRISHKVAIKKCKAIITISEFSKKRIHEKLKYPLDKIWLIYCGIDQNDFIVHTDHSIKEKYHLPEHYFLSLSTLEPRKNLQLLIRAYDDLTLEGKTLPPLVLAGRKGWKIDEIFNAIDKKTKGNIIFTGFIDNEDLADVYADADLFIFPSMYEGFGIPPLEAMECSTLVLSSDAASLPEVVGDSGLLFRSNDKKSLENEMLKFLNLSDDKRIEINNRAKKRTELFNWNKEADKLYKLLWENQ